MAGKSEGRSLHTVQVWQFRVRDETRKSGRRINKSKMEVKDNRPTGDDLPELLQAIYSTEVVESRVQLIKALGDEPLLEQSDLPSILECLITWWEDFTCLDASQCMLNSTILHVAAIYLKVETAACRRLFLVVGAKACAWCGKHLKVTLMPNGESQEDEHSGLFFQLLLELLNFSAACFSIIATSPIFVDAMLWDAIENFTQELLNLLRELLAETKKIQSLGSELLKSSQLVLEAVVKSCRVYSEAVNWDSSDAKPQIIEDSLVTREAANVSHVTNILKCTIQKLCELGTLAANGGGSLVSILNSSWKGVVSLLQLGKGSLAEKVNICDIIKTLLSLATGSLNFAAECWSTSEETISSGEAKRVFLPVKFYLINAVRISSRYPCQAALVYSEITKCILIASTFAVLLSNDAPLKNVVEAIEEHLKPTLMHLLNSLLNSTQLDAKVKVQILDFLFSAENESVPENTNQVTDLPVALLERAFSMTSKVLRSTRFLLLGRFALFVDLMKVSPELEEDVILWICRKLEWLLDTVVDEMVYSSILVLQMPGSSHHGKTSTILWQPMFSSLIHALKILMISLSSSPAWSEYETFLLDNFLHPHLLCHEIVMELWSFMVRHAEEDSANRMLDKLCSLYKLVASSFSFLSSGSALRKMARSMCKLLSCSKPALADRVYSSIVSDESPPVSVVMWAGLLLEGFQLDSLSDDVKSNASERMLRGYHHFIENWNETTRNSFCSDVFGIQVFFLSATLQSLQVSESDIDARTVRFLIAILHSYNNSTDSFLRNHCCRLISETLWILSKAAHLFGHDQMERVIFELKRTFITTSPAKDSFPLQKCKSGLAFFVASLAHMKIEESEGNAKSCAVWELYHMLLREKHWALVHLTITAFGHFAALTLCNQLWRFVPKDAALSFDVASGTCSNEERFMSEFKVFLEKEIALPTTKPSCEQIKLAMKDGLVLKEMCTKKLNFNPDAVGCKIVGMDGENSSNKRRRISDGLSQGVEMFQSGLKLIGDGLSDQGQKHPDLAELHSKISVHFSELKDMINQLACLAGG